MDANNKPKIFIVDDDNFLLDMYALKFSQSGFEVETAPNAMIALEKLRGGLKTDVMLLDIIMPEMDGFQLLEQAGPAGLLKNILIVTLSNRGQQSDIEHGKKLGAHDYIVKATFTPTEVVTRVKSLLSAKKPV